MNNFNKQFDAIEQLKQTITGNLQKLSNVLNSPESLLSEPEKLQKYLDDNSALNTEQKNVINTTSDSLYSLKSSLRKFESIIKNDLSENRIVRQLSRFKTDDAKNTFLLNTLSRSQQINVFLQKRIYDVTLLISNASALFTDINLKDPDYENFVVSDTFEKQSSFDSSNQQNSMMH